MMSRVKQGLSPTEETVVDSATGTVMSSAEQVAAVLAIAAPRIRALPLRFLV